MISREWAVEVVERHLRADWLLQPAAYRARLGEQMVITAVHAHELGWLISCQSRHFVETRDFNDALVGHGPFLVDGLDGSLHMVHQQFGRDWPAQYLEKVRGQVPPRALDVEIVRLIHLGRRYEAFKEARSAGGAFSPADAQRYVDAVGDGLEPPPELVAKLPQSDRSYRAVSTYSGPNPEPSEGWQDRLGKIRTSDGPSDRQD